MMNILSKRNASTSLNLAMKTTGMVQKPSPYLATPSNTIPGILKTAGSQGNLFSYSTGSMTASGTA